MKKTFTSPTNNNTYVGPDCINVKRIDLNGRVSIPREIRRLLQLELDDEVEIKTEGNKIIIQKHIIPTSFQEPLEDLREIAKTFKGKRQQNKLNKLIGELELALTRA